MSKPTYNADASALGYNPICDICKKRIFLGEHVIQSFVGPVVYTHPDETELGVEEELYSLVHSTCKQ